MKTILSMTLFLSFHFAQAFNVPNDFPEDNNWAKSMTSKACKVKFNKNDVGTISESKNGVIYTVYNKKGVIIASAWAQSTFILAKKRCLTK